MASETQSGFGTIWTRRRWVFFFRRSSREENVKDWYFCTFSWISFDKKQKVLNIASKGIKIYDHFSKRKQRIRLQTRSPIAKWSNDRAFAPLADSCVILSLTCHKDPWVRKSHRDTRSRPRRSRWPRGKRSKPRRSSSVFDLAISRLRSFDRANARDKPEPRSFSFSCPWDRRLQTL